MRQLLGRFGITDQADTVAHHVDVLAQQITVALQRGMGPYLAGEIGNGGGCRTAGNGGEQADRQHQQPARTGNGVTQFHLLPFIVAPQKLMARYRQLV